MLRRLFWITALSVMTTGLSARAGAIEPDYPCYMRTSSGRLMNLGAVCSGSVGSLQLIPSVSPTSYQAPPTLTRLGPGLIQVREGREAREGGGQYYSYEVMTDRANSYFRLRYRSDDSSFSTESQRFSTAQEAVDYFECKVINKATAACPKQVTPYTAR